MKSSHLLFAVSIVLFISGCAQKVTVKALEPAEDSGAANTKNIAVTPFHRDYVNLADKIEVSISKQRIDGKPYFTVINRTDLDTIIGEQKIQNSGLMDESTAVEVGNLLGALLLCAIQLGTVVLHSISIWLLVSFIMFLYRFYHYYLFKHESETNKLKDAKIWLDKYYTNTLLSGIVWGSSAFLIFPESELLNQMIVIFFLFAIGFSAMGILASKRDLLLTYALVTYSPILLRLFFMEDELYAKSAYIILALMLIMILTANYYGKVINNALNNRQHFISIKHTHEKLKERFFSLFERAPVGIYYYNSALELEDVNMHFMHINKIEDKELESQFKSEFPFQETPDQEQAIEDIKKDLSKRTPMDRIICGDVGFGKTEVAMRASLFALTNKRQVALICPTTILANKHFNSFKKRCFFVGFNLR